MLPLRPRVFVLLGFAVACARTDYASTGPRLPAKAGGTAIVLPASDGGTYGRAGVIAEGAH